jgi:hypothetical protein
VFGFREWGTLGKPRLSDLAYAAGFVDGEGCIRYHMVGNGGTPQIIVVNTCHTPILWLRDLFGGAFQVQHAGNAIHRTSYKWVAYGPRAIKALRLLLPHLREKAEQAELVLKMPDMSVRRRVTAYNKLRQMKRMEHVSA